MTRLSKSLRVALPLFLALALFSGPALLSGGCTTRISSARRGGAASLSGLADRIWAYAQEHPDGFTVDVRTMAEPTEGIAVSHAATQGSHSRGDLDRVVGHALDHDGYAGGWYNPENALYYFDSTRLFPEDRLEDALQFGRENGQQAVYILSTGTEIAVDGAGGAEAIPDTEKSPSPPPGRENLP